MGIGNLSLAVAVPPEVRNSILGGLPAMRATNDRDGVCSPKVIEEFAAFLVLAPKPPNAVINVIHLDSLPHKSGVRVLVHILNSPPPSFVPSKIGAFASCDSFVTVPWRTNEVPDVPSHQNPMKPRHCWPLAGLASLSVLCRRRRVCTAELQGLWRISPGSQRMERCGRSPHGTYSI